MFDAVTEEEHYEKDQYPSTPSVVERNTKDENSTDKHPTGCPHGFLSCIKKAAESESQTLNFFQKKNPLLVLNEIINVLDSLKTFHKNHNIAWVQQTHLQTHFHGNTINHALTQVLS